MKKQKKQQQDNSFADRFKGRTSTIDKQGVLGVVLNSGAAIEKYNPPEEGKVSQQQQRIRQDYSTPNMRSQKSKIQQENDVLTPIINKYANSSNFSSKQGYVNQQQLDEKKSKNTPQLQGIQKSNFQQKSNQNQQNSNPYSQYGSGNNNNMQYNDYQQSYSSVQSPLKRHSYLNPNQQNNNNMNYGHSTLDISKTQGSAPSMFRSQLMQSGDRNLNSMNGQYQHQTQQQMYGNSSNYNRMGSNNNNLNQQMFMSLNNDRLLGNNSTNFSSNSNFHSQNYLNSGNNTNTQLAMHTMSVQSNYNGGMNSYGGNSRQNFGPNNTNNIYDEFQLVAIPKKYLEDQQNIFTYSNSNNISRQSKNQRPNYQQGQGASGFSRTAQPNHNNNDVATSYLTKQKQIQENPYISIQNEKTMSTAMKGKMKKQSTKEYMYQLDELENKHMEIIKSLDNVASTKKKNLMSKNKNKY